MEQAPQEASNEDVLARLGNALLPEAPQEAAADEQPAPQETEAEQAEESQDDGLVELELEGDVVRVPPKLKEGYLRHSDYTRKAQDLANLQRQTMSVQKQQEITAKFQQETQAEQRELARIQAEIARYRQADLSNLAVEDYIKTRGYLDQLKDREAEIGRSLNEKAVSVKQQIDKYRSDSIQSAYEFIGKHVKDWTPNSETEREVAGYAGNYGIPPEALVDVALRFPGFAVMAAKAAKYDGLQKTKMEAVRSAQKAPPVVKPGAVTSTSSQAAKNYKNARAQLKKSGDLKDAAAAILQRM